MKKQLFFILLGILCLSRLSAQSKVFSKEFSPKNGETIIYTTSDMDYYGVIKNGEVISAYTKDKHSGAKKEVVFNGKSGDGKMTELGSPDADNLVSNAIAKSIGETSGAPKCIAYQLYECEIVVGRDPATGTSISRKGQCVRQVEVECPKQSTRTANESIKVQGTQTKSK